MPRRDSGHTANTFHRSWQHCCALGRCSADRGRTGCHSGVDTWPAYTDLEGRGHTLGGGDGDVNVSGVHVHPSVDQSSDQDISIFVHSPSRSTTSPATSIVVVVVVDYDVHDVVQCDYGHDGGDDDDGDDDARPRRMSSGDRSWPHPC